eukprot:gene12500-21633_t
MPLRVHHWRHRRSADLRLWAVEGSLDTSASGDEWMYACARLSRATSMTKEEASNPFSAYSRAALAHLAGSWAEALELLAAPPPQGVVPCERRGGAAYARAAEERRGAARGAAAASSQPAMQHLQCLQGASSAGAA